MAEASQGPTGGRLGGDPAEPGRYRQELKRTLGSFQVFAIPFAFSGAGVVVMGARSRLVHVMSRDARFPAYRPMCRVNPRTRTPLGRFEQPGDDEHAPGDRA
ncbi:hypothetical protein AB0D46_07745 [Streptomyces sp. NPDC048383]|uniref:hypothetical protein n=1 Tax=Streptomyces sp. NPDC048383 TaxID=3155386 RepID=UPI0034157D1F